MTYTDLVALNAIEKDGEVVTNAIGSHTTGMLDWIKEQMEPPATESFQSDDWFAVGKAKREMLGETCPGMGVTQEAFKELASFFSTKTNELIDHFDL